MEQNYIVRLYMDGEEPGPNHTVCKTAENEESALQLAKEFIAKAGFWNGSEPMTQAEIDEYLSATTSTEESSETTTIEETTSEESTTVDTTTEETTTTTTGESTETTDTTTEESDVLEIELEVTEIPEEERVVVDAATLEQRMSHINLYDTLIQEESDALFNFTYSNPSYGTYNDCFFIAGSYINGTLSLEIWSASIGKIVGLTVTPNIAIKKDHIAIKNYDDCEGTVDLLKSMKIIEEEPYQIIHTASQITIPVYKLTNLGKTLWGR